MEWAAGGSTVGDAVGEDNTLATGARTPADRVVEDNRHSWLLGLEDSRGFERVGEMSGRTGVGDNAVDEVVHSSRRNCCKPSC